LQRDGGRICKEILSKKTQQEQLFTEKEKKPKIRRKKTCVTKNRKIAFLRHFLAAQIFSARNE
jgi:hypothetical protein